MLLFLSLFITACFGEFLVPEVTLEAFKPKGFRVSIPDVPGISLFVFGGKLNKDLQPAEGGDYYSRSFYSENGQWTYFEKDLVLKPGDFFHYYVFIEYGKFGYRKDDQRWTVTELLELKDGRCTPSESVVLGKSLTCKESVIFEDNFNEELIDERKWLIEQYIATSEGQDFEFVSYQKNRCRIVNGTLNIAPQDAIAQAFVEGELDLRRSCTRQLLEECFAKSANVFILPPVTSGRMVSKIAFRYGKIQIKAKLPAGDWIYPQMYLEQVNNNKNKIWVGYTRGNDKLVGGNGQDIGSTLLFGGPVMDFNEPERSHYLRSYKSKTGSFTDDEHIFTVIWEKNRIRLELDGIEYGSISEKTMREIEFSESDTVRIVLGVGVGGVNDFPDDFKSGNDSKPWKNRGRAQLMDFFEAREKWYRTWTKNRSVLKVKSVIVTAL